LIHRFAARLVRTITLRLRFAFCVLVPVPFCHVACLSQFDSAFGLGLRWLFHHRFYVYVCFLDLQFPDIRIYPQLWFVLLARLRGSGFLRSLVIILGWFAVHVWFPCPALRCSFISFSSFTPAVYFTLPPVLRTGLVRIWFVHLFTLLQFCHGSSAPSFVWFAVGSRLFTLRFTVPRTLLPAPGLTVLYTLRLRLLRFRSFVCSFSLFVCILLVHAVAAGLLYCTLFLRRTFAVLYWFTVTRAALLRFTHGLLHRATFTFCLHLFYGLLYAVPPGYGYWFGSPHARLRLLVYSVTFTWLFSVAPLRSVLVYGLPSAFVTFRTFAVTLRLVTVCALRYWLRVAVTATRAVCRARFTTRGSFSVYVAAFTFAVYCCGLRLLFCGCVCRFSPLRVWFQVNAFTVCSSRLPRLTRIAVYHTFTHRTRFSLLHGWFMFGLVRPRRSTFPFSVYYLRFTAFDYLVRGVLTFTFTFTGCGYLYVCYRGAPATPRLLPAPRAADSAPLLPCIAA